MDWQITSLYLNYIFLGDAPGHHAPKGTNQRTDLMNIRIFNSIIVILQRRFRLARNAGEQVASPRPRDSKCRNLKQLHRYTNYVHKTPSYHDLQVILLHSL